MFETCELQPVPVHLGEVDWDVQPLYGVIWDSPLSLQVGWTQIDVPPGIIHEPCRPLFPPEDLGCFPLMYK